MIIVDTNVISEAMRPEPDRRVMRWLAEQDPEDLFTTAITAAEMRYGVATMPAGRRRAEYERVADAILQRDFAGRVLPFDAEAAVHYATIAAQPGMAKNDGSLFDAMIASIALRRGAPVATRNVRHFAPMGVAILNPWDHP
ncbi:MAG: VapC toxin family PIN domain ribonuclease [Ancylobacter novellus]|uniref:Ribonuclease VapC n=1 Tax=Ancylobacter novellus TaxID=921 RepID=A0A2W5KEP1_ANCNO|nr:MAG: VapC toxin family PIN domain ribonuclease [Ancylobacter novellus]